MEQGDCLKNKNMTWNEDTRILKADTGKWVTEDDISFAIEVKLAPSENVENWWEVDTLPPEPENVEPTEQIE